MTLKRETRLWFSKIKERIILKKAEKLEENLEEDLEFAKRTEEAWKAYERGEFVEMDYEEFLDEVKKW
jgi:aspartyl/asparaginyl-tRNA synthetase